MAPVSSAVRRSSAGVGSVRDRPAHRGAAWAAARAVPRQSRRRSRTASRAGKPSRSARAPGRARESASRRCAASPSSSRYRSRMLIPPVKASRPSTTRILRWLRRFKLIVGGQSRGGRNRAKRTRRAAEQGAGALPRVPLADAVEQHAHVDAALRGGGECCRKPLAQGAAVEDVGAEIDVLARRFDGADHRVEDRACFVQQLDAVPRRQRPAADGGAEPRQRRELRRRCADVLRRAIGRRKTSQELAGAGSNAVDAEQVVEESAEQRQREAEGDPAERRLRSALVEQCVQGCESGGDESDGGESGRQNLACLHAAMCNICPEARPGIGR